MPYISERRGAYIAQALGFPEKWALGMYEEVRLNKREGRWYWGHGCQVPMAIGMSNWRQYVAT